MCAIVTLCVVRWCSARQLLSLSPTIFLASFILGIIAILDSSNGKWLLIANVLIYAPALSYLGLLFICNMFTESKEYSIRRLILLSAFAMLLPTVLHIFFMKSYASGIMYYSTAFVLVLKLLYDKTVAVPRLTIAIRFAVLLALIGICVACFGISLGTRINVFTSQGTCAPYDEGWYYFHLISALRKAPFIGETAYSIPAREGVSVPAYLYFAYADFGYAISALILKFGWIALFCARSPGRDHCISASRVRHHR